MWLELSWWDPYELHLCCCRDAMLFNCEGVPLLSNQAHFIVLKIVQTFLI